MKPEHEASIGEVEMTQLHEYFLQGSFLMYVTDGRIGHDNWLQLNAASVTNTHGIPTVE
jgi:hypothetical protein